MIKKFFKKLGKGLVAGIVGAGVGVLVSLVYLVGIWLPSNSVDVGLAVVVIIPILIVLSFVVGAIVGGFLGVVGYFVVGLVRVLVKRFK